MSKSSKRLVVLRVCASCEWVFKIQGEDPSCPKCNFGSYGARYVYGNKAYTYAKTQAPWMQKKMQAFEDNLRAKIEASKAKKPNQALSNAPSKKH